MKQVTKKVLAWSVTVAFFAGALGGILTNEYFIAYVVDLMGGKIQENDPIVKRVVEEKVYIESSQNIEAVKRVASALLSVEADGKRANGFMVSADGLLMTHASVLTAKPESGKYEITLRGGAKMNAVFVAKDEKTGVALLKVNGESAAAGGSTAVLAYPVVEFADVSKMEPAQTVLALELVPNSPLELVKQGVMREYGFEAAFSDFDNDSAGESVAKNSFVYLVDVNDLENLGAPLVNLSGQVGGMIVDSSTDGQVVLSATELKYLLDNYLKKQKFEIAEFGLSYEMIPYGEQTGLKGDLFKAVNFSASVKAVKQGGFASKAGLQVGDEVLSVNDKALLLEEGLYNVLRKYQPTDAISIKVLRDGKELTLDAQVALER